MSAARRRPGSGPQYGANPYWGQTGHYSIASAAIECVENGPLRTFLKANIERISFRPDELTPRRFTRNWLTANSLNWRMYRTSCGKRHQTVCLGDGTMHRMRAPNIRTTMPILTNPTATARPCAMHVEQYRQHECLGVVEVV